MATSEFEAFSLISEKTNSSESEARSTTFVVDTGRFLWAVFLACLIFELALVYLDLTINWFQWSEAGSIRRLFNVTREDGLASWFAVTQTVFVAVTAWIIFATVSVQGVGRGRRTGWLVIAVFFSYMAIDDGAAVHERIGSAFKESSVVAGFPSYAWQVLLVPFFGVMGSFILIFLWIELPRWSDRLLVAMALACFSVALALDFVEGLEDGYWWWIERYDWDDSTIKHFSKSIEEFVEMLGMSIFLVTFLGHVARTGGHLSVQFVNTEPSLKRVD